MTDGRVKALEAVAEAARNVTNEYASVGDATTYALDRLCAAFNDLDGHTETDAETVTLAVWQNDDGNVWFGIIGSEWEYNVGNRDGRATRLGTVTLPITREGGR